MYPTFEPSYFSPVYGGTTYSGPEYVNPVMAPTVLPIYAPDMHDLPVATIQQGTVVTPDHYNRQTTKWAHPSSQSCAAAYLSHEEKWPRIAPGGAGIRRKHRPMKKGEEYGHAASGAFQPAYEAPAAKLPGWQPPVGLPPSVPHLARFGIQPIQPFITPQCLPHQF